MRYRPVIRICSLPFHISVVRVKREKQIYLPETGMSFELIVPKYSMQNVGKKITTLDVFGTVNNGTRPNSPAESSRRETTKPVASDWDQTKIQRARINIFQLCLEKRFGLVFTGQTTRARPGMRHVAGVRIDVLPYGRGRAV